MGRIVAILNTWRMCWQLKLLSPMKRVLPVAESDENHCTWKKINIRGVINNQPTRRHKFFHGFPCRSDVVLHQHHFAIRVRPLRRIFVFEWHKLGEFLRVRIIVLRALNLRNF